MSYTRYLYNRIFWKNKSESLETPIGKNNLGHMDSAIYNIAENLDIVHREMSAGKFDRADADKVIVGMPAWDPATGILTFRFYDGTQFSVDFNVEKIPVSFSMDSAGVITMTTHDGTQWTADIGDTMPDYVFEDSDRIAFVKNRQDDRSYRVTADIKRNSITDEYLQPGYLADLTEQAGRAEASVQMARGYAEDASLDAKLAQSYSVGGTGIREGEESDNARKSKEAAEQAARNAQQALEKLQPATTSSAGLMSAADKEKLDGIAAGANKTTIDSALKNSTNPVQNKVVKNAIDEINTNLSNTATKTISSGSAYVFQDVDVRFGSIVIVHIVISTSIYTHVYVVTGNSSLRKIYESGSANMVSVSVNNNKLSVSENYPGQTITTTARIIY